MSRDGDMSSRQACYKSGLRHCLKTTTKPKESVKEKKEKEKNQCQLLNNLSSDFRTTVPNDF